MPPTRGLRHIALFARDFEAMERFYVSALGFHVEWRPDPDNAYLSSGADNLALHRFIARDAAHAAAFEASARLDHFGIVVPTPDDVDAWHAHLLALGITPDNAPRTHRDGARSFYLRDPDGNRVQLLFHPPISGA